MQTQGTKKIVHKCYIIILVLIWGEEVNSIFVFMEELLSLLFVYSEVSWRISFGNWDSLIH